MNTYVGGLNDDNWSTEFVQPNAGALFDLDAQHAVGFDGVVSAVPLP